MFFLALIVATLAAVVGWYGVAWWGIRQGFTRRAAVEAGVGLIVFVVLVAMLCNQIAGT